MPFSWGSANVFNAVAAKVCPEYVCCILCEYALFSKQFGVFAMRWLKKKGFNK